MSGERQEAHEQHMLLLVETAQRAGQSEREISELVNEAVEVDSEKERAAYRRPSGNQVSCDFAASART